MELKHILASYYPHKPFMYCGKIGEVELTYPIIGLKYDEFFTYVNGENGDDGCTWMQTKQMNAKLVLRNLSDLTKPIEHNGERFVPIYKLWELAGFEIGRGQYITDEPNYIKTSNLGTAQEFVLSKSDILSSNYNVIQKLLEWKFDVFNLIEKGEAIDANTLQTNPYK